MIEAINHRFFEDDIVSILRNDNFLDDFDKNYIPNPFAFTSSAANLDKDEQKLILFSAIGVSLVAGTVDLIIHIVKMEIKMNQ